MSRRKSGSVTTRPLEVRWTERALKDLRAIGDYIARDSPEAAERWVATLLAAAEAAAATPMAGRRVPELRRDDVREVFRKSYRIVYRLREHTLEVLTVFEGHRLFRRDTVPEEP
ncbi:type II toxin-antitoxin system RelE/ParE family toxin [Hyalangium gracile]|uniref:type II toxin-antitoxin system RelE/ParE family toxin n=1 Tax=Hyalangium gracile TaxID=394092 RepID=UPI001CC9F71E|nr:type II toxin-antitoxin system RelE/ParE family toxin [Hyalangium gracile]